MSGKKTKFIRRTLDKQVRTAADKQADSLAEDIKVWQISENTRLRRKIFFVGALNVALMFAVVWLSVIVFKK